MERIIFETLREGNQALSSLSHKTAAKFPWEHLQAMKQKNKTTLFIHGQFWANQPNAE